MDRADTPRSAYPSTHGLRAGRVGVLGGSQAGAIEFFENPGGWGLAIGLISATVLLYLRVSFAEVILLGFGIVGLFIFLAQVIGEYLADGIGGPLAVMAAGIALLLLALVAVRLRDRTKMGDDA